MNLKTVLVMNGRIPAVIVNGMGQPNPTFEQAVAEYRQTQAEQALSTLFGALYADYVSKVRRWL